MIHQPYMITLQGRKVGPIGYGLMGLTWRPDAVTREEAFKLMDTALDCGSSFWNGGEFYGTAERNSLHLLHEYFSQNPARSKEVFLSLKGGMVPGKMAPDCSEAGLRRSVDECLRVLDGTKRIDLFEFARIDRSVPLEESIKVLGELVKEGKIGGIGLSEVNAETIRRAHEIHPITAVEVELSLWETGILHNGIATTCCELGIPIVAYAPLSRGALSGVFPQSNKDIPEHRRRFPKFQDEALKQNLLLSKKVEAMAANRKCAQTQIAMGWIRGLQRKQGLGTFIPIPGAERPEWIRDNNKLVDLTEEEMAELEETLRAIQIVGHRYFGLQAEQLDV